MTLSSNETTWAVMVITLIVTGGFGLLCTWLTIKAQHIKSIDELVEYSKKTFVRLFILLSNLLAFAVILFEVSLTSPVDRKDIFLVVWSLFIFMVSLFYYVVELILKLLIKKS